MFTRRNKIIATSFALAAALFTTTAQAGSVSEYSRTWKPGFSKIDNGPAAYERVIHDSNAGYKTGSASVVRTIQLNTYQAGAVPTENGFELVTVEFDPSQVETAAGELDDRPLTSLTAKPDYFFDDSDYRYHLVK